MSTSKESVTAKPLAGEPTRGRRLARWLSALGLLSVLGGGAYLLLLWEPRQLPVRVVTVNGKLEHLSAEQLQATVSKHLSGGILTQDLAGLKAAVEAMPWVQSASLRRHWPDRLELAVRERVPLARWGDDSLVTAQGVVFRPDVGGLPAGGLAKLSGRREEALLLVESFQSWGAKLHAIGLQIEELDRDPRGAWMLRLSGGVEVALGTALTEQRLSRFVRSYPRIVAAGTPSLIDMRYSNGLAIRWADPQEEQESADGEKAARAAALIIRPSGPPRS